MRHVHRTHHVRAPRIRTGRGHRACRAALTAVLLTAAAAVLTVLTPQTAVSAAAPAPRLGECAAGELCLWERADFKGPRRTHELADTDIESCVPLPKGTSAASLANRTGRPVTAYQSAECAETGEFDTYPSGSWAPRADYRVRAVKIWES
ncbi:peptidase inhibitor family I36 protein [Streptomyces verrucosisporus]|uniref:peptidase inhibitor family I36 protein n=1 Tax=Streptomyces verrucosisporus TaxID=1695161 RepID=UPI0019CF6A19|nr:peptidase inhibitor family I36 protein [Streptomyces verrucosisporus]MBN3928094.1 peptidase inhibitor family I36 protein [Streptomyces verrucosisporus]